MSTVILGLGHEFRRDDGVGAAVAGRLVLRVAPEIRVCVVDGDPSSLLEEWDGADLAVLIDSVAGDCSTAGAVHRFDSTDTTLSPSHATSTHGLGLVEALRLGSVLDRMPRRWVLYTVEVTDLGFGRGLSAAVDLAVDAVVAAVVQEVANAGGP